MTGGKERLGEWQIGLSEGIKGMWIQLTVSQTLSRSPSMCHWEYLACRSPQPAHGHPQCSLHLTHTNPNPVASSLCTLPTVVERVSFGRWLVSTHKKPAQICEPEREHKLEL